ncbi:MAG TPA: hypothetical protein PL072_07080 [Phycisphaerales bacterium]|nr:hypothetical protein [Phycisphaerales bacterium]
MSTDGLRAIRDRVERVLQQADLAKEPEAKSDLACLACILTSAMIEVACREYVGRYAANRSAPTIAAYVRNKLYFFQNAKSEDIDGLLRGFAPELADEFSAAISDEVKDAVDSVVGKKNELVHGKGVGIGLDTMKRYHKDVLAAIEVLRVLLTKPITR